MTRSIEEISSHIAPADHEAMESALVRHKTLTKPPGSLGRLEEVGVKLAGITGTVTPGLSRKRIYVVAADHGVVDEGVSAYPRDVTFQMVFNFLRGGAAINVLARHGGIEVLVVDAGVDYEFPPCDSLIPGKLARGTRNMALGPAMTRAEAEQGIQAGIELASQSSREGVQILGIGEMGIGNSTPASAITSVLTGLPAPQVTGRGTGIEDKVLARKVSVVERAITVNAPRRDDPAGVLASVGGFEIAVMAGIVIGAAAHRIPVVSDGFISTAAAAIAVAIAPLARDYLFVAHRSAEPGHQALIEYLGVEPLIDLGMRLGEGTGAALAMHLIDAAARVLAEMATFDQAGVSDRAAS